MPAELTDRFGEAARWAAELHRDHRRKGNDIPYVSHLFAVAALVLEDGGSEDEAISALLHDSVEDNKTTFAAIRERFGDAVTDIVRACSDTDSGDDEMVETKKPWRQRKEGYIAHLLDPHASASALRVSNADKVHNARCILADYRAIGDDLWTRFNPDAQSADIQLWYYEQLADAFATRRGDSPLVRELTSLVAQLRSEAG
jgi:(p)ppGpp synthase/HD superfamily hydrolase